MKKAVKILGILLLVIITGGIFLYFTNNEKLPEGNNGNKADKLATKMLTSLNYEAYKNTRFLEWSFRGKNFYKWNKKENIVIISWENYKVIYHTKSKEKSVVFIDDKKVINNEILEKGIAYFNNDSFWLVAHYKLFEPGVTRKIVQYENIDALMITYTSGGTTPGDSYLWILDKNGKPISYKMWVSIIPTGGMEASWNDWVTTASGAILPKTHKLSFGTLDMGDVKGYN